MFADIKLKIFFLSTVLIFFINPIYAEEEEIYLKAISDQIQVITKDLKHWKKQFIKNLTLFQLTRQIQLVLTD